MACERCGRCCHDFGMYVADDGDIARLFAYHGFETDVRPEGIYVKGSNPCEHLHDGGCDIYEDRPQICRDYLCEKAREGMELNREMLMERRRGLEADVIAINGAIQQVDWCLEKLEEKVDLVEATDE